MKSVFEFDDYRKAFTHLFQGERARRPGWSTASLAEKIRVQPSHLTNVIKGRAHFSSDQIYAISSELGLSVDETAYLDTLKEWERADYPARKSLLLESLRQARDRQLRADKKMKAKESRLSAQDSERYYLDPNIELLHLYLGTKGAENETSELARVWGLSSDYVAEILQFLEKSGLIERRGQRWHVQPIHQLLPTGSPLVKPAQMLRRMRAIEAIQKARAENVYSFTAALSMTEDTRLFIRARFLEFLKEIEEKVLESPAESLYQMQFDLFPWLETKKTRR